MSTPYTTRLLTEAEYDRWHALVESAPSGSIYALPTYLDILCSVTNGRFQLLGLFHGDELVGGMPLYLRRTLWGEMAAHRALLAYHSPVLRPAATGHLDERSARHLKQLTAPVEPLRATRCLYLALHVRHVMADVRPFQAAGWQVRPEYSYVVDLTNRQALWARLAQNQRRLVKRAAAQGLTAAADDDFASFFRLHHALHLRKRAPLYLPERSFRRYVQSLLDQKLAQLYHARLPDGRAVATQLVLTGPRQESYTVCAAADEAYQDTGANPFLRWTAFSALSAQGVVTNDLTGAPYPDTVTHFKSQLGGELVTNWLIVRPETGLKWLWRTGWPRLKRLRDRAKRWLPRAD